MEQKFTQRVFVYGSLKRGYALHHFLQDQAFLGTAVTLPQYRLYDCGSYPGMIRVEAGGMAVTGEVYHISDYVRNVLDDVEGVDDGLYVCRPVKLAEPFHTGEVLSYLYRQPVTYLTDCGASWPAD